MGPVFYESRSGLGRMQLAPGGSVGVSKDVVTASTGKLTSETTAGQSPATSNAPPAQPAAPTQPTVTDMTPTGSQPQLPTHSEPEEQLILGMTPIQLIGIGVIAFAALGILFGGKRT